MTLDTFLSLTTNGLSVSSILLLVGLGLSVTFGIMGVINFAIGGFIMIGGYMVYVIQSMIFARYADNNSFVIFLLALPFSFFVAGFIGFILEKSLIRFLYAKPYESMLATWGVSLIMQQLARNVFGSNNVVVNTPVMLSGGLHVIGGFQIPYNRLFILSLSIIAIAGVYLYLYRTNSGRKIRAVMQNRNMSACLGIPTGRIDSFTFAFGSGLAGIAGCALSLLGPIGSSMGEHYIVDAFMVVVLGGVGSLAGTVGGSIVIGMLSPYLEFITTSSMGRALVFIFVIILLQWKPEGLFVLRNRTLD